MITLFRRIRERLIASGSISKYLIYAVGEILLVVIGILIALQVNNWNEDRKDQIKTRNYLLEMTENLESDVADVDEAVSLYQSKDSLLTAGIRILVGGSADSEIISFLAENSYELSTFFLFEFKSVAFENMTSTGNIDLLQDLELRNNLTAYYQRQYAIQTGTQSRVVQLVRAYIDYSIPLILNRESIQTIMDEKNEWPEMTSLSMDQKARLVGFFYNIRDNMRSQSTQLQEVREHALTLLDDLRNHMTL